MAESGLLTAVRWEWDGTELSADAAVNAAQMIVKDPFVLSTDRQVYVGGSGPYTITSIVDTAVNLSTPLTVAVEDGEPVVPDAGGGPGKVWIAEIVLIDADEPIEIMLVTKDLTFLPEGEYDPPKAILISDDLERVLDLPGSTPIVVDVLAGLGNNSMEDPYTDPIIGSIDWNSFANWRRGDAIASGGVVAQHIDLPISGSRSLRITMAGPNDGQRIITRYPTPVSPGQIWNISAKFRTTRTIDKALVASGEALLSLIAHTSDGTVDPEAPDGLGVSWTVISAVDYAANGVVLTLAGTVQIPTNHRLMRVSFLASPALDGLGYSVDVDEVSAEEAAHEIQVADSTGAVTASINDRGDATVHDLVVTGQAFLPLPQIDVGGETLLALLERAPKGLLVQGNRFVGGMSLPATSSTHIMTVKVEITSARAIRLIGYAAAESTSGDNVRYGWQVRYTFSTTNFPVDPTETSPYLEFEVPLSTSSINYTKGQLASVYAPNLAPGFYKFALYVGIVATGQTLVARQTWRLNVIDEGAGVPNNAATYTGVVAEPTTYTKTYIVTDTAWYDGGGARSGTGESQHFGNTSATGTGRRKSVLWFNRTAIGNDIGNAASTVIDKVELYLYLYDGGSGNTVPIGRHADATPNDLLYGNIVAPIRQVQIAGTGNWDEGVGRWVNLTDPSLKAWKSGDNLAGYIIGPSTSDADNFAGSLRGVGHSLQPKLRITYRKE